MTPVTSPSQVFEAIQRVKAAAPAFCTNFFPVESRLQSWIDHQELFAEPDDAVACFFRRDRDFFHFYFSAPNLASLTTATARLPFLHSRRLTTDVIGQGAASLELAAGLEQAGFRRYSHLVRLARSAAATAPPDSPEVQFARETDGPSIIRLLEQNFNPYADQLPLEYELAQAIARRQILVVQRDSALAALLYFETQGVSSVLRFWVVAETFRSSGFGSLLIRHYFASQTGVRRFILWVRAAEETVVQKYQRYGYAPDGLVDHVLVNPMIP